MPLSEKHAQGAFISSRSIFESDIWINKPPEYFKIWFYLYGKANHEGRSYNGHYCERGQYFCTYEELNKQLEYFIGARKKKYHGALMKRIMVYLRSNHMVDTLKEPRGVLITLIKYDTYQRLEHYENTTASTIASTSTEPRTTQERPSINKNIQELKNEKNKDNPIVPKKTKAQIQDEQAQEVLDYFNHKLKEFNPLSRGLNGIGVRRTVKEILNKKYTVDDCKKIIDNKAKDSDFMSNKNGKYFRPSTLFCDKHAEEYLNETDSFGTPLDEGPSLLEQAIQREEEEEARRRNELSGV